MAADNDSKLWLQSSANQAATMRALEQIEQQGRALPCRVVAVDGSIVTVAFEIVGPWTLPQITLPKAESQWLRAPTQVGDFGYTAPADTTLWPISGLAPGTANATVNYGNLGATLMFVPVGSTNFTPMPDPNKAWVNGPNGAVISDSDLINTITVDKDPSVTIAVTPTGATTQKIASTWDGVNNKIQHQVQSVTGPVLSTLDAVNNKITHTLATGEQHIIDGVNHTMTHIADSIGLGAAASTIGATGAAVAKQCLDSFQTNLLTARLQDLISMVTLLNNVGTMTGAQLTAALVQLVAGFLPGIPTCGSATVFIKA